MGWTATGSSRTTITTAGAEKASASCRRCSFRYGPPYSSRSGRCLSTLQASNMAMSARACSSMFFHIVFGLFGLMGYAGNVGILAAAFAYLTAFVCLIGALMRTDECCYHELKVPFM